MRNCVLSEKSRLLLRGVAVIVLAGFATGCSSDLSRFTYKDFTTGSVNQSQIIRKAPKAQPFPDEMPVQQDVGSADFGADTGFEPAPANSVMRKALAPAAAAAPLKAAPLAAAAKPVRLTPARQTVTPVELAAVEEELPAEPVKKALKKKAAPVDETVTGTVEPKVRKVEMAKKVVPLSVSEEDDAQPKQKKTVVASSDVDKGGWSKEGGTVVTIREGETLYNFSKRFGVPVASLLKANGLTDAAQVQAGQKIIVPAYRYSKDSGVSAPDNDFETASAKSTAGTIYDVQKEKVPLPRKQPARETAAVLPTVPQVKQKVLQPAAVAAAEPKTTAKTDRIKPVAVEAAEVEAPADTELAAKPLEAPKAAAPRKIELAAKPVEAPKAIVAEAPKAEIKKPAAAQSGDYAVAQGDSLYKIAKAHGVSVEALQQANGLTSGKLKIGQPLRIPAAGDTAVSAAKPRNIDPIQTSAAGQTAKLEKPEAAEAKQPAAPKLDQVKAESDQDNSDAPNATGISKLRWPVRGRTVTGYGQRDSAGVNDGVNISVPEGTPIKAAENGVVIYAGNGLKEFGNTVLVRHADGLVTVYGHASALGVKRGDKIKRGQELGKTGMTGSAKAPMLHFEVRKDSSPVDPSTYLE